MFIVLNGYAILDFLIIERRVNKNVKTIAKNVLTKNIEELH